MGLTILICTVYYVMISRIDYEKKITACLENFPITTLTGPRQSGKTTLATQIYRRTGGTYLDTGRRSDRLRLSNPESFLASREGLVVIDEIQEMPELFNVLRVVVDDPDSKARFLVLGSASPGIVKGVSETLAGRTAFVDLSGFNLLEVGAAEINRLWFRGGFPRAYLSSDDETAQVWLEAFIRTFIERDLPGLGYPESVFHIRRLLSMIASCHGQLTNYSAIASSMGITHKTVQKYSNILEGAYIIRRLRPYFTNTRKRLVKSPKIYIRDTGILHYLLQIDSFYNLLGNAAAGYSWEGFALEQLICKFGERHCYFWRTSHGAELDLLVLKKGKKYGFEIKMSEAPGITRSMRIAMENLELEHLWCIYPGKNVIPIDEDITLWPMRNLYSHPLLTELS